MATRPSKRLAPPAGAAPSRTLGASTEPALRAELYRALAAADDIAGASYHPLIHELWMRGELGIPIERARAALWKRAADSVPDWLPMPYVDRLADLYEISGRFVGAGRRHREEPISSTGDLEEPYTR
jgi:hypothetical protein